MLLGGSTTRHRCELLWVEAPRFSVVNPNPSPEGFSPGQLCRLRGNSGSSASYQALRIRCFVSGALYQGTASAVPLSSLLFIPSGFSREGTTASPLRIIHSSAAFIRVVESPSQDSSIDRCILRREVAPITQHRLPVVRIH